jgi:hypothetical protein
MIEQFTLKFFKGHGCCSSGEVEQGNEGGIGRIQASKDVGDEIIIFYRLSCMSKQV